MLFLALTSCKSEKGSTDPDSDKLPILGRRTLETRTVDGKQVVDTIYHTIPDFQFVDQDSSLITEETVKDKIYVADFFFTSCPTICPTMKREMLRVYDEFIDNENVLLLSHSIDPEFDTVNVLHNYASRLGVKSSKWHFLTGDKEKIYEIGQRSYLVTAGEDDSAPGGYIHSGAFILVDKNRRIRGVYDGTKSDKVDELMQDMNKLLAEDAS